MLYIYIHETDCEELCHKAIQVQAYLRTIPTTGCLQMEKQIVKFNGL